jgi:hypothetical protein
MHFRFTIRDLLWLTLVVAILAAWWLDHAGIQRQREQLTLQQIELREKTDDLDKRRESVGKLLESLQGK